MQRIGQRIRCSGPPASFLPENTAPHAGLAVVRTKPHTVTTTGVGLNRGEVGIVRDSLEL